MKRNRVIYCLIICALTFLCGAGLRYCSTMILYISSKKEMTDYLEQMRNMRLKLSKEMLENDREKEIIVKPYDNKIYDMYGKAFDSDFICKNGTKFEKDNVIKDGLSAFTIAMATMHSLYGNDVSKDALPCQIYLGDSISVVLNTAHTTGIVLRNSDGKIISY